MIEKALDKLRQEGGALVRNITNSITVNEVADRKSVV